MLHLGALGSKLCCPGGSHTDLQLPGERHVAEVQRGRAVAVALGKCRQNHTLFSLFSPASQHQPPEMDPMDPQGSRWVVLAWESPEEGFPRRTQWCPSYLAGLGHASKLLVFPLLNEGFCFFGPLHSPAHSQHGFQGLSGWPAINFLLLEENLSRRALQGTPSTLPGVSPCGSGSHDGGGANWFQHPPASSESLCSTPLPPPKHAASLSGVFKYKTPQSPAPRGMNQTSPTGWG